MTSSKFHVNDQKYLKKQFSINKYIKFIPFHLRYFRFIRPRTNVASIRLICSEASHSNNRFSMSLSMERNLPFSAKNRHIKILQRIYFACDVGIINSYSNRIFHVMFYSNTRKILNCNGALHVSRQSFRMKTCNLRNQYQTWASWGGDPALRVAR